VSKKIVEVFVHPRDLPDAPFLDIDHCLVGAEVRIAGELARFRCTRPFGHEGPHIAHMLHDGRMLAAARWEAT
jgi:hypothetical protein